jgi:Mn2+/Fe2+ NRAMP family transporter
MLPPVLIFMLLLINNKEIMGEHTNSKAFDIIAWGTVVIMIVLTLILVMTSFL